MNPSPHLWFLHAKQRLLYPNNKNGVICTRMSSLYGFQPSSVFFFMQNSDFMTRLTSLYGSQTSSVVLSKHNSVINTRIKRLYGFQPSPVVLCMQTATLLHESLVSMGPSPHLRFLLANQRLLDQNCMSLLVPELTCDFLHAKQHA